MPFDQALYEASGKTVDWLHSIGAGFHTMGAGSAYGITPYLAPGCYMGGFGQAMESLVDRIGKLGGTIVYDTPVTELVQGDDGRVTGLLNPENGGRFFHVTDESGAFGLMKAPLYDFETYRALFSRGDACGSIEEKDGKPYGRGFDAAMNFGYIMGETVDNEMA